MADKNETVAEILREMREMTKDWIVDANANFVFVQYADRIEEAHRREVEEKINAITRRYEQLKTQCLKICGKRECDNRGIKCIQCAMPVLDFLIRGKSEGAAK